MLEINNFYNAGRFFLVIAGELALIFVAVSFLIGLLMEYLPPSRIREFLSKRFTWMQYLLGAGLGGITPFCSCSTVPIMAGLLKGGVPFGPVMAFLFSSPLLNPLIIALLLSLLGYQVTVVYFVVTFFCSMITAAVLSKLGMEAQVKPLVSFQPGSGCSEDTKANAIPLKTQPSAATCCFSEISQPPPLTIFPTFQESGCCSPGKKGTTRQQPAQAPCCSLNVQEDKGLGGLLRIAFMEKMKNASLLAVATFKGVFWYLLLGAAIGAFIYGFFPQDLVVKLAGPGNPWSVPIAAVIGVPMYIRASTSIPIGAALVGKGMGVGTVLALIIGGAGASIPEMVILGSMFKKKLIFAFALNVFIVAIVAGYLVDFFIY